MSLNSVYTNEYLDIISALSGDAEGQNSSVEYMQNSTAIVKNRVVEHSFMPRLYSQECYERFVYASETMHAICEKVITHYLQTPAYREIFDFDPRLVELILLPRGYDALLPFARVDIFLNEDTNTYKFCELNADGSSGMNEDREIFNSIKSSESFRSFSEKHKVQTSNLFQPWVRDFIEIYSTYEHKRENPHFAICDYLQNAVVNEFEIYTQAFKDAGFDCSVYDVRDLRFNGEELIAPDGKRVDAIWRRCVTNDVLEFWDESQDLLDAVRNERVALIGSFAGHIVHDKQIFQKFFHEETKAILSCEELDFLEKSVPRTRFLSHDQVDINEIISNKDNYIIKPTDAYGSKDVFTGCMSDDKEWSLIVNEYICDLSEQSNFLVQDYCVPFKTLITPPLAHMNIIDSMDEKTANISLNNKPIFTASYNNLSGLYLYNGKFQGVFSRLGPFPSINKMLHGITAATVWVDCDLADNVAK